MNRGTGTLFNSYLPQKIISKSITNNDKKMKKLFILMIALLPFVANAQSSQVKVSLRNGTAIEGEVKEFDALDHITLIVGGVETTIPMSQVAYVTNLNRQEISANEGNVSRVERVETPDVIANYKGFLLAKGNNVYVHCSNSDSGYGATDAAYIKAAHMVLTKLLKQDGFWNVVDRLSDAHFTINYYVDTDGRDKTLFSISSWRSDGHYTFKVSSGNENYSGNGGKASVLYS